MRRGVVTVALTLGAGLSRVACSSTTTTSTSSSAAPSSSSAQSSSMPASSSPAPSSSSANPCSKAGLATLVPGKLTIGTDKPAYDPWFSNNDPTNGKGFESAASYAIAKALGFERNDVTWTVVPFNSAIQGGPKKFDFDINQISITTDRKKVIDFSDGYYTVNQAVISIKGSPAATATTIAALGNTQLGAQLGTTSLTAITSQIKPSKAPRVYNTNADAVAALKNKQIDALVVDLPTAFYLVAAELDAGLIVGQLPVTNGTPEQFGLLLSKGSTITSCLNTAIASIKADGSLAAIQSQYLGSAAGAPTLK